MKIKKLNYVFYTTIMLSLMAAFSHCKKDDIAIKEEAVFPSKVLPDTAAFIEKDTLSSSKENTLEDQQPNPIKKDSLSTPPVNLPPLEPEQTLIPISGSAFYVEKALPDGYVKDGSIDYTNYIQYALTNYTELVFPDFPILINDTGLRIPSNRIVHFSKGSELRLKPSSKSHYQIIKIENANNVTLVNPYIIGDRYEHKGTSGEWGMGIGIYGSSDINISGAKIYNCWGDGIYIGGSINRNIRLIKPFVKGNRRDGISIINVNGLEIVSPYAGFSDGTAPYSGINIEPNSYTEEVKNIKIINPVTESNKGYGIQAGLGKLYGGGDKQINILIENHIDKGSSTAFLATCRSTTKKGSEMISGTVTVLGSNWQKNSAQPLNVFFAEPYLKFQLSNPRVMSMDGFYLSDIEAKTLLEYKKSIWKPTNYTISF